MTIENLKQIAIKYATTKGSRVPLAPDELCNAVVQYMNSFFGVMTDINTIKVAVTENSGNIVFTITGNTYDGKAFTPIVITVDHNDFVTDQEFEAFKTTTNAAIQKNTESINSLSFRVEDTENDIAIIQVQAGQIKTRVGNTETDVRNLKNRVDNTETNIAKINSTLNNKLDKNTSETQFSQAYIKLENGDQGFVNINPGTSAYSIPQRSNIGRIYAEKGAADDPSSVANMRNIADVTEQLNNKLDKISSVSNSNQVYGKSAAGENLMYNLESHPNAGFVLQYDSDGNIYVNKGSSEYTPANMQNISDVEAKIPDTSSFVTLAGNNTYTGTNTFNSPIFEKQYYALSNNNDIVQYGYTNITRNQYTYTFPNKSGTFAMTTDIINEPIYFISFNSNAPDVCHLMGTMMSKKSYGTGQKTIDEFAVMLADNLYTNSNEGLAVYGRLEGKDILCIYSDDDGLSIRCLDEENSEVYLPAALFFVMETKL